MVFKLPASEIALIAAEMEATMIHTAVWMVYSEADDGAGGRTESWLATNDPGTNQPTIPISIFQTASFEELTDRGSELAQAGPMYRGKVPLRIAVKVRDRLVMSTAPNGDGHTYEVLAVMDEPTLSFDNRWAGRRL